MPVVDLAFGLQGTTIPTDHGYVLYSAICRIFEPRGEKLIGLGQIATSKTPTRNFTIKVNEEFQKLPLEIAETILHCYRHLFYPVARLATLSEEGCELCYEFAYIGGALEARGHGFRPFLAFPDLNQVYRSPELFPLFANRLLSPSRIDYPQYIERLGLTAEMAEPIVILGRSGGSRATDTVELFPLPTFDPQWVATPRSSWPIRSDIWGKSPTNASSDCKSARGFPQCSTVRTSTILSLSRFGRTIG